MWTKVSSALCLKVLFGGYDWHWGKDQFFYCFQKFSSGGWYDGSYRDWKVSNIYLAVSSLFRLALGFRMGINGQLLSWRFCNLTGGFGWNAAVLQRQQFLQLEQPQHYQTPKDENELPRISSAAWPELRRQRDSKKSHAFSPTLVCLTTGSSSCEMLFPIRLRENFPEASSNSSLRHLRNRVSWVLPQNSELFNVSEIRSDAS